MQIFGNCSVVFWRTTRQECETVSYFIRFVTGLVGLHEFASYGICKLAERNLEMMLEFVSI